MIDDQSEPITSTCVIKVSPAHKSSVSPNSELQKSKVKVRKKRGVRLAVRQTTAERQVSDVIATSRMLQFP